MTTRRADLDWLRVIAFGLLILYHAGMAWSGWSWHVTSADSIDWLSEAMRFLNRWRMPLLFLVSGAAIMLALGDRSYGHFCGFGHQLDTWLRQHGAHPLFDAIEVDNADPAALRHWQQLLGQLGGNASELPDWSPAEYQPWTLLQREHLNPGSPGGPVYWLRLQPPADANAQWQAGDIAEIGPQHASHTVRAWLDAQRFDADTVLDDGQTLLARVARSHLPSLVPPGDLPALLATLQSLPHREYSIASVMADGAVELLLRHQLRADGTPGIGSGWLCDHAAIGEPVQLRLRRNDNFHGASADVPLLLIAPGVTERFGSRREVVGTQVDVVPTIMGRLGGEVRHQCWGRDLLSLPADDPGFGIVKPSGSDQTVALIRGDRVLVQPKEQPARLYRYRLGGEPAGERIAAAEDQPQLLRQLHAYLQTATASLLANTSGDRSGEGESEAVAAEVPLAVKAAPPARPDKG